LPSSDLHLPLHSTSLFLPLRTSFLPLLPLLPVLFAFTPSFLVSLYFCILYPFFTLFPTFNVELYSMTIMIFPFVASRNMKQGFLGLDSPAL
jgi:hypothetical protein